MAVMTNQQRTDAWAELMRALSDDREAVGIVKADLKAALDAADQWVSDNAASYNSALPAAARTGLTTPQKARLLMFVLRYRYTNGT